MLAASQNSPSVNNQSVETSERDELLLAAQCSLSCQDRSTGRGTEGPCVTASKLLSQLSPFLACLTYPGLTRAPAGSASLHIAVFPAKPGESLLKVLHSYFGRNYFLGCQRRRLVFSVGRDARAKPCWKIWINSTSRSAKGDRLSLMVTATVWHCSTCIALNHLSRTYHTCNYKHWSNDRTLSLLLIPLELLIRKATGWLQVMGHDSSQVLMGQLSLSMLTHRQQRDNYLVATG
jgi:hypothetical protein